MAPPAILTDVLQMRGDAVKMHGSAMNWDDILGDTKCRGDWGEACRQLAFHLTEMLGTQVIIEVRNSARPLPRRCGR